jgi:hypothetical protein
MEEVLPQRVQAPGAVGGTTKLAFSQTRETPDALYPERAASEAWGWAASGALGSTANVVKAAEPCGRYLSGI